MEIKTGKTYRVVQWLLWGLLIAALPVTSFPLITRLAGGTMVGPASILPLLGLIFVWWLPYVWKSGMLARQSLPLLGFAVIAVLSSLISFFLPTPPFKTAVVWREVLEGVVTLMIGVSFFVISSSWPRDDKRLSLTLKIINWTGLIILLWSIVQGVIWMQDTHWPVWLRKTQKIFSSGTLYKGRVTGLTFEPSWLAHQLNMLYLPIWLSASIQRFSVHKNKILGVSLENVLLLGGAALLFVSKSRLGLLAFLLCVAYLLFELSLRIVGWLQGKFKHRDAKRWAVVLFYLALVLLTLAMLVGTGFYLSKADPRMSQLFDLQTLRDKSFLEYAEQLAFSARIVYWKAGWDIFGQYPMLGVGLGNAGFYFYDKLDPYSWELMEVRDYMFNLSSPPNIKSLWVRLLAETGIVGLGFWVVWLVLILFTAISLRKQKKPIPRVLGLAGILALLALLIDGFSLDTFALPYFWVTFGLLVACKNSTDGMAVDHPSF